jgi:hypothetical protein
MLTIKRQRRRPVALTARASDSKSEGWGFESLLACHFYSVRVREDNKRGINIKQETPSGTFDGANTKREVKNV